MYLQPHRVHSRRFDPELPAVCDHGFTRPGAQREAAAHLRHVEGPHVSLPPVPLLNAFVLISGAIPLKYRLRVQSETAGSDRTTADHVAEFRVHEFAAARPGEQLLAV